MSRVTYATLVERLYPRITGGIRWGLDRTRRLLAGVGDPQHRYTVLHVGGTNGKGSVAATMASVLAASGRRAGLYTSPHLVDFRERIQVNGVPITEAALLNAADRLWPAIEAEAPSFFEATTAIALLALADAGADVVVAEVGMGGRLDATNVVDPVVTAITNVHLDHGQYLGDTVAAVAGEKAGIIKAGVPLVTTAEGEALGLLRRAAAALEAPVVAVDPAQIRGLELDLSGSRFELDTAWGPLRLRTPLVGRHQALNAALAVRALERLPAPLRPGADAVRRGVAAVRWPGRTQCVRAGGTSWILDSAHNPAGVEALLASLAALDIARPLVLLVGIMGDKDWLSMLPPLLDAVDRAVLSTPPAAPADRRWQPHEVVQRLGADAAVVEPDFGRAVEQAKALAGPGTVLVTGSFHTVGAGFRALGIDPYGRAEPRPSGVACL